VTDVGRQLRNLLQRGVVGAFHDVVDDLVGLPVDDAFGATPYAGRVLHDKGQDIEVMTEDDFIRSLNGKPSRT